MNILGFSLKDISYLFDTLESLVGEANYDVNFTVKAFLYTNSENAKDFSLTKLQEIFFKETEEAKRSIDGDIKLVQFEEMANKIAYCLEFHPDYRKNWKVDSEALKVRQNMFWNIVKKYFVFPPTIAFEHKPSNRSFFGGGVMWEFCYILLNDNTKEGIVIAGQAYD